jgi:hypothetical protein
MSSTRAALTVLLGSLFLAAPALAAPPAPVFDEARLEEAQRALEAAKTLDWYAADAVVSRSAAAVGLGGDRVRALLTGALAPCLARHERCREVLDPDPPGAEAVNRLVALLGVVGGSRDLALLRRVAEHGFTQAEIARDRLLDRELDRAVPAARCAPPSDAEIARARADLDDFAVIHAARDELVASAPTAQEREDLAYFFAAVSGSGPEVGGLDEATASASTGRRGATPKRDAARDALEARLDRAKLDGDFAAITAAARGYLATFGFPSKSSFGEETRFSWGGARFSYAMRDLADADEATGHFREAAALYRKADPGGGMCGTSVEYVRADQTRAVIRNEERAGQCRAAIPERLLALGVAYGPERLARAGFDVARLYRGALVTINRDVPRERLREAIAKAPPALRDRALARLTRRGSEDWERRVHAAEGLADVGQRAAMRPLLAVIAAGATPVRVRAITALGELARRPTPDPCVPQRDLVGGSTHDTNGYHRDVRDLGRTCATKLLPATSDALASALLPHLASTDLDTRLAAAEALGRIGSSLAAPAILRLTTDAYTTPNVTRCTTNPDETGQQKTVCGPIYPVREAAEEASELLGGARGAYVPRLVVAARPRAAERP